MKNKVIQCITALLVLAGVLPHPKAVAQDSVSTSNLRKFTLAVQPFYISNLGMRLDVEKRIGNTNRWLQLGPTAYLASSSPDRTYQLLGSDGNEISGLLGGGLNLGYKEFMRNNSFFYWQGGVSYTHYAVKYRSQEWTPYMEDGLTYVELRNVEQRQNFNKLGASVLLGGQTSVRYAIFADAYLGLGYSYSFYNADKPHFSGSAYGFGYRGILFIAGLRIGFGFGKVKTVARHTK